MHKTNDNIFPAPPEKKCQKFAKKSPEIAKKFAKALPMEFHSIIIHKTTFARRKSTHENHPKITLYFPADRLLAEQGAGQAGAYPHSHLHDHIF